MTLANERARESATERPNEALSSKSEPEADRGPRRGSRAGVVVATGRKLNPKPCRLPSGMIGIFNCILIILVEHRAGRYRFRF